MKEEFKVNFDLDSVGQKYYLHAIKEKLQVTWPKLSEQTGISERALRAYLASPESPYHRRISRLARRSLERLLKDNS